MIIFCDGGSRGNPGPAASAFVVTKNDNVVAKGSKYLNIETNNVAEYSAVIMALNWLIDNNINEEIVINLDSQLIERQINGFYKVKNDRLILLNSEVKKKLSLIKSKIKFIWNYRSDNHLADTLVNEELDNNLTK